ncbi:MAG: hypothetical protein GC152_10215 [Alphaproteobacteria bacterium]|nr:hypothetical protein [Alphaproteobacteria bacterium]
MEDLSYIIGLGFSGADVYRALIIAFFMSMLFAPQHSMWKLGVAALLIDKIVWPLVAQSVSGAGMDEVGGSLQGIASSFVDDLGVYVVRYFGLTVLIGMFSEFRTRLHQFAPPKKAAA